MCASAISQTSCGNVVVSEAQSRKLDLKPCGVTSGLFRRRPNNVRIVVRSSWPERPGNTNSLTRLPCKRVQITADQCPRISAEHLAAERIRLGDALYRQEYFGAFVSAPGSVFDAEVLAHMFGDDTEDEPEEAVSLVEGRIADRFLQ